LSNIFNQRTAVTTLQFNDALIPVVGMPCKLRNYIGADNENDIYGGKEQFAAVVDTHVVIEHNPDKKRLKAMGLWQEDKLPIVAHFMEKDKVARRAEIEFDFEYSYDGVKHASKFQVVDIKVYGAEQTALQVYLLAPVRGADGVCNE